MSHPPHYYHFLHVIKDELELYAIVCVISKYERMNNQLPLSADAVLGKDVHSGRDGIPSAVRNLFAVAHSVAHTSVLMSIHCSKVVW